MSNKSTHEQAIEKALSIIVADNPECLPAELRQICFTTATRMSPFAERVQRRFWALVEDMGG